ncbi:hypothetical protein [Pseudodonghicola flavimaris]|uniref:Uncharacterized protein n=1 Tax=Pseudodonghicola flavimaris TaxID=3050036 RepID=A0ABT7F1X7_9RHOB|nr:hypothetical protein [Pseudodonghicola flavimaris]MDK3018611.1 hypothetical protein [Pseudodonghicola flavimaris]
MAPCTTAPFSSDPFAIFGGAGLSPGARLGHGAIVNAGAVAGGRVPP